MSEFRYVGESSEQAEEEADISKSGQPGDVENEPSPHEGEEGTDPAA